ncbi:TUBE [Sergentomyia squamirostris]
MTMITRKTEIRHLSSAHITHLAHILDSMNNWKKLMRSIPKKLELDEDIIEFGGKYTIDHEKIIESNKGNRLASQILLDEWGTSGKVRPNLSHLLQLLIRTELFRAAEFVAGDLLQEPLPKRPEKGPAAKVDITLPDEDIAEVGELLTNMKYPNSSSINNMLSQVENNRDFYDKWIPDHQRKIQVVDSVAESVNLMQFSNSAVSVTATNDDTLSLHSDIVGNDGIVEVESDSERNSNFKSLGSSIGTMSTDIPDTVTSNSENIASDNQSELVLPDVSLLRLPPNSPPAEESSDNLPHFSLLMPKVPPTNDRVTQDTTSVSSISSDSSESRSEIILENSIPNLPLFQGK